MRTASIAGVLSLTFSIRCYCVLYMFVACANEWHLMGTRKGGLWKPQVMDGPILKILGFELPIMAQWELRSVDMRGVVFIQRDSGKDYREDNPIPTLYMGLCQPRRFTCEARQECSTLKGSATRIRMLASKCEGNPKLDMWSPKVKSVGQRTGKSSQKRKGYRYVNYRFRYVRDMKKANRKDCLPVGSSEWCVSEW